MERNRYEHRWYEIVRDIVPHSAPRILAFDEEALLFVMEYLPPETHRLWKAELLAGKVDPEFAAQVGETLGRIHQRTAGDAEVARMINITHQARATKSTLPLMRFSHPRI